MELNDKLKLMTIKMNIIQIDGNTYKMHNVLNELLINVLGNVYFFN